MKRFAGPGIFQQDLIINQIKERSRPISPDNIPDSFIDRIGDARIVMLGEASHGTHEFYTWRAAITRRLIEEKNFNFIAVEGDWPDCYRINRYIKQYNNSQTKAIDVLKEFNRWPTWMWANWEIEALAEWIYKYNRDSKIKVGFYGLDVYSLWESMEAIMEYLRKVDPGALRIAESAFRCFEPYRKDEGREYAMASSLVPDLCRSEVLELLTEIRHKLPQYNSDPENVFSTEQNALVTVNAERYYRAMLQGDSHSWNVRDRHMQETLDRLLNYHGSRSKCVVWAHNTHIGDARATDMVAEGMYNIGELARTAYKSEDVFLVGFGSYKGSVIAGRSWGSAMRVTEVPEAQRGSWEYYLHSAGGENKLLLMEDFNDDLFMEYHFPHRAIGVVYNPQYEQYGNYVPSLLPLRYDAFIHIDETHALHPLHLHPDREQVPETYPFGF